MIQKTPIDIKKVFILSLISFAIIEGLLFLADSFGITSFVKGGFFLLLMLLVIFLSTLFNLGTNVQSLKLRDIILMGIVLLVVVALYFLLPLAFKNLFSIIPGQEIRDQLVKSLNSVVSISGTGIA